MPGLQSGGPDNEVPFATVIEARGRRLLAAVNQAAAVVGLAPGMPLADALSLVPELLTAPAEPSADAAALTRLAEWCGRYSPWTAPDDADGIKVEITGCAHLWGGEDKLAADLARRLARQGIAHGIAIAGTLGAASALARFAAEPGRPALPGSGDERAALAPLPVEALRLDPATVSGLRRVGLRRVGDLYPMPREALARRFGEIVPRRLDQALGLVSEPLSPMSEAPVRRVRLSFAEPISELADLARAIKHLAAELAAHLERAVDGARWLGLAFHRVDGRVEHIRVGTARPSREARHLAGLLAAKLETVDPGLGVEDMILALLAAEPLAPRQIAIKPLSALHGNPLPGRVRGSNDVADAIAPLLDRLGARLGLDVIGRIAMRESHIPERASFFVPVGGNPHPNPPPQAEEGTCLGLGSVPSCNALVPSFAIPGSSPEREGSGWEQGGTGPEALLKPLRPVRLFMPPEPVEAVWVLPDEPPFRFAWRRRAHSVCRAEGPERIAEEWWTPVGAAAAVSAGAIRDYYRVEDAEGRRFWLFRAGLPGMNADRDPLPRWYIHGLFA